jgi:endonuclease-8
METAVPEGHTIHRLARDLARDLVGPPLRVSSPQGRVRTESVDGSRLEGTEAVGKHLFLHFSEATLHVHLGLFGRFRRARAPRGPSRPTIRLRLETETWVWELSGATASEWIDDAGIDAITDRLGPDPLSARADPKRAWQAISRSRRPLAALLLDQKVIAGIGNVYRAELLHILRLPPDFRGEELAHPTFRKLWRVTQALLERGVKEKRIRTVDGTSRGAGRKDAVYVYGRASCHSCEGTVRRATVAQRTLYYCPSCQAPRSQR